MLKTTGIKKDVPAVLVVAGGEGMGPVEKTCSAIAKASGVSVQLVVVTGRNAKLAERLKQRQWPPGMHVSVQVRAFAGALASCLIRSGTVYWLHC